MSGMRRDIRRGLDSQMRQTMTMWDQLKNQIPGLSTTLPPRHNRWGEPMEYSSFFSNRYKWEELEQDPVDRAIQQLIAETGRVVVKMPKDKHHGVELTAREYVDLVKGSRAGLKQEIWELIQTPDWEIASPDARVDEIQKRVRARDTSGRQYLFTATDEEGTPLYPRLREKAQEVHELKMQRQENRDPDAPYIPNRNFGF
jgi:hypothetical protein